MKKLTILATFLLVIQSINLLGQIQRQNGLSISIKGPNTKIEGVTIEDASPKTKHLRFLTQGYLKTKVDGLKDEFYLRYNIFEDEMEFRKENKIYFLTKTKNQKINFTTINKNFTVLNFNGELGYFEVNCEGEISLYTKRKVEFKKGKVALTQFETSKKSKFIEKKDTYYISTNGNEINQLPKGKKDFMLIFGNKSKTIKEYMKKEKLSRKKIKDVIAIIKYYNSL